MLKDRYSLKYLIYLLLFIIKYLISFLKRRHWDSDMSNKFIFYRILMA